MELAVLKARLLDGSVAGTARVALAIPIYLILTPFLLHTLGPELFGIWSLGTVATGIMGMTDVGLKNSLVFHVARAQERPEEIGRYFNVAFWAYAAFALAAFALVSVLGEAIVRDLLHVPDAFRREALFVLVAGVAGFGLRMMALTFQAVMEGHQDLYHSNLVSLGWLLFNAVGTVVALIVFPGVYSLGIVLIGANLLVLLWSARLVTNRFPFVRVNPQVIRMDDVRAMARFGAGTQLATLATALREPLYKILVARTYGLTGVAVFEVVYRLSTQIISLFATPLVGLFGASAMLCRNEQDLGRILRPFIGYTVSGLVPCVLFVWSFAEPLVGFWLGGSPHGVDSLLPPVLGAFALYYGTEALYRALQGAGFVGYSAIIQLAGVAVNVATFVWLAPHGLSAIPLSLLAGFLLFSVANYVMFQRRFPGIAVLRPMQLFWVLLPVCAYLVAYTAVAPEFRPIAISVYLAAHLVSVKYAGLFDLRALVRNVVAARSRFALRLGAPQ